MLPKSVIISYAIARIHIEASSSEGDFQKTLALDKVLDGLDSDCAVKWNFEYLSIFFSHAHVQARRDLIASGQIGFGIISTSVYYANCKRISNKTEVVLVSEIGQLYFPMFLLIDNLRGEIPTEIGNLPKLRALCIQKSIIAGSLPTEICRLSSLELFRLDRLQLSTKTPIFYNLVNLMAWELRGTITGSIPTEIGKIYRLRSLCFTDSHMSGQLPTEIGKLVRLTDIVFDREVTAHSVRSNLTGALPTEFGSFKHIRQISILANFIEGTIPTEIGLLDTLIVLNFASNRLTGELPSPLGRLSSLIVLDLTWNSLDGTIPANYKSFKNLQILSFAANHLEGTYPAGIGQAGKLMQEFHLFSNLFTGQLPLEIFENVATCLRLSHNLFTGTLPSGGPWSQNIVEIHIGRNRLSGTLPSQIFTLVKAEALRLSRNHFSGQVPSGLGRVSMLEELALHHNVFKGPLPPTIWSLEALPSLGYLTLGWNALCGTLPTGIFRLPLRAFSVATNNFKGQIPSEIVDTESLRELYLFGNRFSGSIPERISNLNRTLDTLLLHNNKLQGTLPLLSSLAQLRILTLHRNKMSGFLEPISNHWEALGLLTLHDNRFVGSVPKFWLRGWCLDSLIYRDVAGFACHHQSAYDCEDIEVFNSCPKTCAKNLGQAEANRVVIVTLHHNMLSCRLPREVIAPGEEIRSVVSLGNLFDEPGENDVPWLSRHERDVPFLFNWQTSVSKAAKAVLKTACCILGIFIMFRFHVGNIGRRLILAAFTDRIQESNVFLHRLILKELVLAGLVLIFLVLPLYLVGSNEYYECGRMTAKFSVSYFGGIAFCEFLLMLLWSFWFCFNLHCVSGLTASLHLSKSLQSMGCHFIKYPERKAHEDLPNIIRRACGWLLWMLTLLCLCLPSLLFCITRTLPEDNTIFNAIGPQGVYIVKAIQGMAPLVSSVMNWVIVPRLTKIFSSLTGCPRIILSMHLWSATSWLIVTVCTIIMHENCAGKWKLLWDVCKSNDFDESLGPAVVLRTEQDLCRSSFYDLLSLDDRCPRSVLDTLHPLFLGSFACWAFVSPFSFLVRRAFYRRTRRCKMMERGTTRNTAFLARILEMTLVWGPCMPALILLAIAAIVTHLVILRVKIYDEGPVSKEKDKILFPLLRTHFIMSVLLSHAFQLWFAFSSAMYGRHLFVFLCLIVLVLRASGQWDLWEFVSSNPKVRKLSLAACNAVMAMVTVLDVRVYPSERDHRNSLIVPAETLDCGGGGAVQSIELATVKEYEDHLTIVHEALNFPLASST